MANYGYVRLTVDGRPDLKKKAVNVEVGGKPIDDILKETATKEDLSGEINTVNSNIDKKLDAPTSAGTENQMLALDAQGKPVWVSPAAGSTVDSAMSGSSTNPVQNKVIKEYVDAVDAAKADKTTLDNYALKTGSYDTLTAGMAKNIEGQSTNEGTYLERPTAYPTDVATGVATVEQIKGHSVVWNQLVQNGNFSNSNYWSAYGSATFTVSEGVATLVNTATSSNIKGHLIQTYRPYITGHKYFFVCSVISNNTATEISLKPTGNGSDGGTDYVYCSVWTTIKYIWSRSGTALVLNIIGRNDLDNTKDVDFSVKNVMCFDLTLIFGAGNEPTTVAEFEAWLEQNVGLKPYYAYDAGSILNNKLTGFKTIGRNLLNPTTNTARLLSYEYGDNDNKFCIKNLPESATLSFTPDATGVAETVTPDSNGIFTISGTGTLTVTTDSSLADTYVCFVWDGTMNDETVAYEDHTYDFDVTKIYGQLNGVGDYVQVYPNGMLSVGSVKDVLTKDGAVVNVGRVDLGDLSGWNTSSLGENVFTNFTDLSQATTKPLQNCVCGKYSIFTNNFTLTVSLDKVLSVNNNTTQIVKNIYIKDTSISSSDISEGKIAKLNGVYLNYELATPLVYTNLVYRDNNVDTPLSEIFPINMLVDNWSTEQALVTAYSSNAPTSCAPTVETLFGLNVAEWIDSANNGTFISADSIDALLSALGTAMGGTWSKTWDSTNGKWGFTFTPSSNFLATGVEASGTWGVDETTKALTLTPDEE